MSEFHVRKFKKDHRIFNVGARGDAAYLLRSGADVRQLLVEFLRLKLHLMLVKRYWVFQILRRLFESPLTKNREMLKIAFEMCYRHHDVESYRICQTI